MYPGNALPRHPAVLIHSSLSAFGTVAGGEGTVCAALAQAAALRRVTLIMPAHSDDVPPAPFDKRSTPCRSMGRIPEWFRAMPRVRRSDHPVLSFAALGPASGRFARGHRLSNGLGPSSPLGTLAREDAFILMLGTGWETCTALHLAEYPPDGSRPTETVTCSASRVVRIGPVSLTFRETAPDAAFHTQKFPETGEFFETRHPESVFSGALPNGKWKLFRIRALLEAAAGKARGSES